MKPGFDPRDRVDRSSETASGVLTVWTGRTNSLSRSGRGVPSRLPSPDVDRFSRYRAIMMSVRSDRGEQRCLYDVQF